MKVNSLFYYNESGQLIAIEFPDDFLDARIRQIADELIVRREIDISSTVPSENPCPNCDGQGYKLMTNGPVAWNRICSKCDGTGRMPIPCDTTAEELIEKAKKYWGEYLAKNFPHTQDVVINMADAYECAIAALKAENAELRKAGK